jgi:hypothetical protein
MEFHHEIIGAEEFACKPMRFLSRSHHESASREVLGNPPQN